jgi:DNA-binding NtrC family response regulator
MSAPQILLVNDEPNILRDTKALLEGIDNCHVETAASGDEALQRMHRGLSPNLIVVDLATTGMDGLQTLEGCRKIRPDQKVVIISSLHNTQKVVQAIKLGAEDYLTKPFQVHELQDAVRRLLLNGRHFDTRPAECTANDGEVVEDLDDDLFFLAASSAMKQVRAQAALIAKVDVPVLLLGETGVGKEVVARLIHKMSVRADQTIVRVNCAALPVELLESELFGHEAGAFTGALKAKPGKFELARKGTILLDEIGEMIPPMQAKLLHVLQDGQFSRLGGRSSIKVNARVLAATNIEVQKAIAEKKLREDLYYRLNAITISIPPLRERREEIPLLLGYFMNRLAKKLCRDPLPLSERLVEECLRHNWPGNARELANFVKRYLILGDGASVSLTSRNGHARM